MEDWLEKISHRIGGHQEHEAKDQHTDLLFGEKKHTDFFFQKHESH